MKFLIVYFLVNFVSYIEMSRDFQYLTENEVQSVLDWDAVFNAIKQVMKDVSTKTTVIQPPRSFMRIPQKNGVLLTMPGYHEPTQVFSVKLVTSFVNNPTQYGLPSILASVLVFDHNTGKLKALLEGTTITEWRTATASAVAAQTLKPDIGGNQTLAVLGAGKQGRIHIIAFQHFFKFKKVFLWNRTYQKALKLADELKEKYNIQVEVCQNTTDCVKNADVIVTATYASEPILKYNQIKTKVLITAVGAGINHHSELDKSIYEKSVIYTDSMENARIELKGLIDEGYPLLGEIGEILNGSKKVSNNDILIFHSLGMALEDGATAKVVLEKFNATKKP